MNKSSVALLCAIVSSALLIAVLATQDQRSRDRVIGLTAVCEDGMMSTTPRGSGICAGHGGVKEWIEK